jgi:myo-inositol-1(or 4)-monophosphatase
LNQPSYLNRTDALELAEHIVINAGNLLIDNLEKPKQIQYKEGRANIVTDIDLLVEKRIIGLLKEEYPKFNILSEESTAVSNNSDFTWIIDPLDGTNNYLFGIPFFCVTLALAERDEVIFGVTYDPVRKELFKAEKGNGAYLNNNLLKMNKTSSVRAPLIGCDVGYDAEKGKSVLEMVMSQWSDIHTIRILGSAALGLAYVACSRLDIYIQPYLFPWDIATGLLLVTESGGEVSDWSGTIANIQSKQVIASNISLHNYTMEIIKEKRMMND